MLNRSILIGRLTKDPELRYSPSGTAVTNMTLAVDRPFAKDETDFIPIVMFKQTAENCANHLRKGRLCAVEGRIQTRNYENNEGRRVYVTEVVADNVRFLESSNRQSGSGGQGSDNAASSEGGNPNAGSKNGRNDPFADNDRPIDISDDSLPF